MADEAVVVTAQTVTTWTQEADNGSEEHQVKLGRHFLSLAESGIDQEKNAACAVHWLIKASQQGSQEATSLLERCTSTGAGITEENSNEINWCITTSSTEKKIRQAARSLFHQINKTHKEAISGEEYLQAISGLTQSVRQQKLLAAAGKKLGDEINENDFVKMLSKKIQGKITLTSEEMDEASASYRSAGLMTKIFVYPRETASVMLDQGLEWASKEGLRFVTSLVPTNQMYLLAMLFIYSFITPHFVFLIVPLFVFYLSAVVLIISTMQMFYKKRKQRDATELAEILQRFDVGVSVDDTQSQYSWNSLTPYLVFFSTLPLVVISFALANKAYIPCSELFTVAAFMTGFCFIGLSDEHDKLTFFLLAAHTIASLPVFLQGFSQVPIIARLVGLLTQPFFSVSAVVGIVFHLSVPSLFYMVMPVFFVRLGMKKSWSGLHRVVVPHLVCYFWYNVATATYPFTTWLGLARATLGYLLLPILIPLSLVLALGLLLFGAYRLTQTQMLGKIIVTLLLLAVPLLLTQTRSVFGGKVDTKLGRAKKTVMIIFAVLAALPLVFIRLPQIVENEVPALTWEQYSQICLPTQGENVVVYQVRCGSLAGTKVTWKGLAKTSQSRIAKVDNTAESVLKSLPTFISKPLYCIYGDTLPDCDEASMAPKGLKYCQLMKALDRTCGVEKHNVYTFRLAVAIGDPGSSSVTNVVLEAGNGFYSKLMALEENDEVEFSGFLLDGLGTPSLTVKLSSLKVLNRDLPVMMTIERQEDERFYVSVLSDAARFSLNFFFFPVFEYTGFSE